MSDTILILAYIAALGAVALIPIKRKMDNQQQPKEPRPTVGSIVHYTGHSADGAQPMAAIITGINTDGTVALKILPRNGSIDLGGVANSSTYLPGRWTWPPRG